MKIVLDTNTAISGFYWKGAPRQILDQARDGSIKLFTSPELLAELSKASASFPRTSCSNSLRPTLLNTRSEFLLLTTFPQTLTAVPPLRSDGDECGILVYGYKFRPILR